MYTLTYGPFMIRTACAFLPKRQKAAGELVESFETTFDVRAVRAQRFNR